MRIRQTLAALCGPAALAVTVLAAAVLTVAGCAEQRDNPVIAGQDIRVTFLHTSDIHSRLLPYDMTVLASDRALGLDPTKAPFGGIARIAHVIERERARAERVLYVDSGDCFQGAPIFNAFHGEVEQRAMSTLRPDAVVIGNHEFDAGLSNFVKQLKAWASYPLIAANYQYVPGNPLEELSRPYHLANVGGLRVAFIGIANFSSISSITDVGNSLGILPMENHAILQEYIDFISPFADLIVGVSHAGLGEDEEIIQATKGFDIIFGGHLHVALDPPKVILDGDGRRVPLVHSGAFAKYVGKLDVVVRDGEVINHKYTLIPIDSSIPEDPRLVELLEPYKIALHQQIDLASVFGYASQLIRRFGFGGGDAPLGNLVAEAMRFQARADFGMTNTLGIRTDLSEGPVTFDALFNVFPFNNTVTTMFISGVDVQQLLDYVAARSAGRGCATQVQVAGLRFTLNCNPPTEACPDCPRAQDIRLTSCSRPDLNGDDCVEEELVPDAIYEMATNDYIAGGGSGFTILKNNNTQFDTGLPMRDAVLEQIVRAERCSAQCKTEDGRTVLAGCPTYEACVARVTDFHDRFCRKLDETQLVDAVSPFCGHDDMRCEVDLDCVKVEELCADGSCERCETSAQCSPQACEGGACRCEQKFCVPDRMRCVNARCALKCTDDMDCPNYLSTGEELHLCIGGGCSPRPSTACMQHVDCNPSLLFCFGEGSPCVEDGDCAADQGCEDRRCIPQRTACVLNDECSGGDVCQFGWCAPVRACTGAADCDGACIEGTCQETCSGCTENAHCGDEQQCVRGLCIPLVAECHEFRCRSKCLGKQGGISDCANAHQCSEGLCVPDTCVEPSSAGTRCHIENESLNSERCIDLPCPRAEADGRIQTVLPENLADLPSDLNPDDPE